MVPAKETAEEQLLRMIEGPGGSPPSRGPVRQVPFAKLIDQVRSRLERLWRGAGPSHQDATDALLVRLRIAERLFWVVLAALTLYLVLDLFVFQLRPPARRAHAVPAAGSSGASAPPAESSLKSLDDYRETLATRNPFGLSLRSETTDTGPEPKSKLSELIKPLTVVGINRGRVPEALIEDSAEKRTYIVKVGDKVGLMVVKAIDANGITLSYDGEETILQ